MIYKMELSDSVDTMVFELLEVPIVDKDITGIAENTTIDGNVFDDYLWLKKQYVQKWSIMCQAEYEQLRGFWTRQFGNAEVPFYRLFYGSNIYEDKNFLTSDGFTQILNPTENLAPLTLTKLTGNATQKTMSGKNIFSFDIATLSQYPATIDIARGANDITMTATETTGAQVQYTTFKNMFDSSKTYTLSGKAKKIVKGTDGLPWLNIIWRGSNDGGLSWSEYNNAYQNRTPVQGTEYAFDSSSAVAITGYTTYQFLFYNNASNPVSAGEKTTYYDVQLEQNTQATSYEPYVGGVPSPNPDYPQTIKTVTGAQTFKITGKNILPTITGSDTYSGVTLTSTNGTITSSGTATANITFTLTGTDGITYRQAYWQTITASATNSVLLQKGTYYFSAGTTTAGNVSTQYRLVDLGQKLEDGTSISLNSSFTITEPKRLCITIYVNSGNAPNVNISELQLELGNQATAYEPYHGHSQEINLGKNLLSIPDGTYSNNGITATVSDGKITLTGTATATSFVAIDIPPITLDSAWSFSLNNTIYGNSDTQIRLYKDDGATYVGITPNVANAKSENRTDYGTYNRVQIRTSSGVVAGGATAQPQVELGTQATPYAPYKTPIELAKIGTYQDYIWNDNGTWKIHKETKKYVFNGSEIWSLQVGKLHTFKTGLGTDRALDGICDHFAKGTASAFDVAPCFYASNTGIAIFSYPDMADVSAFTTWLSTHNTTVYYALATPTDTEITDSELIAQLNHIYSLYGGVNNLWLIPNAGAQGEIDGTYRLIYEEETDIIPKTPVVLTLTDGGVINPCGCRQDIQLIMRETEGN